MSEQRAVERVDLHRGMSLGDALVYVAEQRRVFEHVYGQPVSDTLLLAAALTHLVDAIGAGTPENCSSLYDAVHAVGSEAERIREFLEERRAESDGE